MKTINPALKEKVFTSNLAIPSQERMTIQGTVGKSFFLIGLLIASALTTWSFGFSLENIGYLYIALFGTLALSLVIIFKPTTAPVLAPVYAIVEGGVLGTLSMVFERAYPGIPMQAVLLTMATALALLFAYQSGWIRASERFKLGVVAATSGIALAYLIDLLMGFVFGSGITLFTSSSPLGILVSLVITAVAALNLVLDFDFIEGGAKQGAAKYMEWYAAFGLMVTLVWLYLEMLRLLGKLQKR